MKKKNNTVPISSMSDLVNLVNHNTEVHDCWIKKLIRSNRKLKVLCVIAVGYAIYVAVESRKQEESIYQLSVKVKKLECGEGE